MLNYLIFSISVMLKAPTAIVILYNKNKFDFGWDLLHLLQHLRTRALIVTQRFATGSTRPRYTMLSKSKATKLN